ncbi:MAG: tryptophan synthase subunit alpha [Solirubrobacterales bacterium]|nr:tryptophan synthase subunit alpha [Solirubrobacterales bacterium]
MNRGEGRNTGETRILAAFEKAKAENRAALMPYMMGGFPDLESSRAIARAYAENGADLIELGIPFSDPLADGPVIHEAAVKALESGTRLEDVLSICAEVSAQVPVVLMVYTNSILGGLGAESFADRAVEAGASGVIIPDLPLGEDESIRKTLTEAGLAVVPLIAPTTLGERRAEICGIAYGFVYVVSSVGTTGERSEVPAHLKELVEDVESKSEVPVAVGFGIGSPEHAATVGQVADGVIIGSKLVRLAAEAPAGEVAGPTAEFISDAAAAVASARSGVL